MAVDKQGGGNKKGNEHDFMFTWTVDCTVRYVSLQFANGTDTGIPVLATTSRSLLN